MVRKRSWPAVSHWKSKSLSPAVSISYNSLECTTYDLQLHGLAIKLYRSDLLYRVLENGKLVKVGVRSTYKVNTDGGNIGLSVGIVGESQQQARLSNTGVTDEEELEKVIVSRHRK